MFRLQTLGGLVLLDQAGAPVALQRRRLALLALLAAGGESGVRRDKLVARLWSESSAENARHALEQLLYSLRRQFPPNGPFSGTDPIRLDSTVIESDVREFESALGRGAPSEAVALYRGPFLDGFYLADEGFEEWVEGERHRLAERYTEALHALAKEAGGDRRHTEAIAWWSRLASLDPLNERSALGLAHALADAGDAASALRQAQAYAERARAELGVSPTPEHAAFVQRIRNSGPGPAEPRQRLSDRYRIEQAIGRGSVATVYLARDLRHNRLVALKVLRSELIDTTAARRFLREISIAASLYHPHIVQLYDSGVTDAEAGACSPFYVMPHIRGESLRERILRDIQIPLPTALLLARQVADALAYAHERGIVHRDIKPENILLEGDHALVADFGIARALEISGGEKLSQSGVVLGTPSYMSPEQGRGDEAADARSDLYSLGCVLYEMLAGEPPFTGRTTQAILARHAADPVPALRTVRPDVPRPLEDVLARTLGKTPASRFPSAAHLARALRDLQA
jgi:DNA-binding SARP family transcriptional activator